MNPTHLAGEFSEGGDRVYGQGRVASYYCNRYPLYLAGEFSEGGGDGVGALGEGRHLKHTHRTVPDHRLRNKWMTGKTIKTV